MSWQEKGKKKKTSPYFKKLVDHINCSWLVRKKYAYPFSGRDFRDLKNMCRIFQEWGVMALWDEFVNSDNDWVRKSGYSISAFLKCVPWLVDLKGWKERASKYEIEVAGQFHKVVVDLFKKFKLKDEAA